MKLVRTVRNNPGTTEAQASWNTRDTVNSQVSFTSPRTKKEAPAPKSTPSTHWSKVLWSDETKIELFGHNVQGYVWRSKAAVWQGGGSIVLWGCFAATGTGTLHNVNGTMKEEEDYLQILQHNLKLSAGWKKGTSHVLKPHHITDNKLPFFGKTTSLNTAT
uniref:Transposase Tc1-like domain-containing protein n=1 Tax=Seriola lalandi dorsalis TaxID=1841481 RepID=A0A3B4X8J7_SERLL